MQEYYVENGFHSLEPCFQLIARNIVQLAKKYHPDANKSNPSAKRKFQEIRDAYEVNYRFCKIPKREENMIGSSEDVKYTTSDAEGFRHAYRTQFSNSFHKIFTEIFENEDETFATDIQVELSLSFAEAVKGCTKHLSFDASVPCDSCNGLGHPLNAKARICPACEGLGRVWILGIQSVFQKLVMPEDEELNLAAYT
ncbi:hypothetical protein U1Q18_017424 [Sarracenia purpurea var. burkii]